MNHAFPLFLLSLASPILQAATLNTPSFTVTIDVQCEEGNVSCDKVRYVGVSKKSGQSISLQGKTLHAKCADGSPCRLLGYEFKSGDVVYRVWEDGRLDVTRGRKVLVKERGEWTR